jgi:putative flippase GtrA
MNIKPLDLKFVRFVLNGLVATAVHYAVLVTLIEFVRVESAGLANGIAAVFGISASYLGNRILVFQSRASHSRTLPRFLLVYCLVTLLHAGVLAIWTDYEKLPYTLGFLLATAMSLLLTYFSNRNFVFSSAVA